MDIINIINTVGFPIACVIAMAVYCKYLTDNYRSDIKEAELRHKEEMDKIVESVNNNTLAIRALCEQLRKDV